MGFCFNFRHHDIILIIKTTNCFQAYNQENTKFGTINNPVLSKRELH